MQSKYKIIDRVSFDNYLNMAEEKSFFTSKLFYNTLLISLLLIPSLDILNEFVRYFIGEEIPSLVFLACGWLLMFLLLLWLFFCQKGYYLLKIFLLLFFLKVLFYIFNFSHFSFNKDPYLIALLFIALMENGKFLLLSKKNIDRMRIPITILLLLSIIPFWGNINITVIGLERVLGIWQNSKPCAYYLFAMIVALSEGRLLLKFVYLSIIIFIGARGAMIAAGLYTIANYVTSFVSSNKKSVRRILSVFATLASLALVALLFYSSLISPILNRGYTNVEPLIYEDIESPKYGQGRVFLNQLLLREIEQFNFMDWTIGRSQTDMLDYYEAKIGVRTFPHNDFMTIIYTNGIFGLIVYFYYLFVYPFFRKSQQSTVAIAVLVISIFTLAATSGFYNYSASYLIMPYLAWLVKRPTELPISIS